MEPDTQQDLKQTTKQEQGSNKMSALQKKFYSRLNQIWDQYYLSDFQKFAVTKFVKDSFGEKGNTKISRARDWLMNKINRKQYISKHQWQKGCSDVVPNLRAIPWWDTNQFPWIKQFQQNYEIIKAELVALRNQKGFQPYRGPSWISKLKAKDGIGSESTDSGQWNVYYLMLHDLKFNENCNKVPKTMQLIEKLIPRNYNHCFFSAATQKTHIIKHHGPTNKKLRFHMPILGVKGSRLRVADQIKQQQVGKCYVFDDSFEHEAWHDGEEARIILIIDFWHPDLSNEQIKFFNLIQSAKMKFEKKISENDPDKDNYFSIIESAKDLIKENDWWVLKQ